MAKALTVNQIVNAVLSSNIQDMGGARVLQLADAYDSLPNWDRNAAPEGTEPSIATTWRSPFIGKSLLSRSLDPKYSETTKANQQDLLCCPPERPVRAEQTSSYMQVTWKWT